MRIHSIAVNFGMDLILFDDFFTIIADITTSGIFNHQNSTNEPIKLGNAFIATISTSNIFKSNSFIRKIYNSKLHSLFRSIAPNMFINSVASCISSFRSCSSDESPFVSTSFSQYLLSLTSLRQILIRNTKSFLLIASFASI
jgi:hypothetical protein